jgi:hypothetical protein
MSSTTPDHILDLLEPSERAALELDDGGDVTILGKIAGDGAAENGDDNESGYVDANGNPVDENGNLTDGQLKQEPKPPENNAQVIEPEPVAQAEPVAQVAKAETDKAPAPVTPAYTAPLPADYTEKLAQIDVLQREAWEKFDIGDLDNAGLQAELSRINMERANLERAKTKAEIADEMQQQQQVGQWQSQINTLFANAAQAQNGGIDYRNDAEKYADLDGFVIAIANNPANVNRTGDWVLNEAHKRVLALHGISVASASTSNAAPKYGNTPRNQTVLSQAPKNLSQVAGSAGAEDVGSEFADIDRLEGFALEDAIRAMPKDKRDRFMTAR